MLQHKSGSCINLFNHICGERARDFDTPFGLKPCSCRSSINGPAIMSHTCPIRRKCSCSEVHANGAILGMELVLQWVRGWSMEDGPCIRGPRVQLVDADRISMESKPTRNGKSRQLGEPFVSFQIYYHLSSVRDAKHRLLERTVTYDVMQVGDALRAFVGWVGGGSSKEARSLEKEC